jgi:hypothetical protein
MDDDVFQWLRGVASGSLASPMLITTNGIARRHERAGHAERQIRAHHPLGAVHEVAAVEWGRPRPWVPLQSLDVVPIQPVMRVK